MKAVVQRVSRASVTVDGSAVGAIGLGLVILLGVEQWDTEEESTFLSRKAAELRIFADEQGKMNRSLMDVGGEALVVSQFTLIADWRKGRRPSFVRAAQPYEAKRLYEHYCQCLRELGVPVATGIFAAHMDVELVNDGPVTLILEHQFPKVDESTTA